jgi:hypothetical protein
MIIQTSFLNLGTYPSTLPTPSIPQQLTSRGRTNNAISPHPISNLGAFLIKGQAPMQFFHPRIKKRGMGFKTDPSNIIVITVISPDYSSVLDCTLYETPISMVPASPRFALGHWRSPLHSFPGDGKAVKETS